MIGGAMAKHDTELKRCAKLEIKNNHKESGRKSAVNEMPVSVEFPELRAWVKVTKPSRPSTTYERME
jgi:hypothetical protein